MKKMKRVLALALALTLCLGLAATVFAALPSYDVIASRIGVSSSLNENDDIIVDGDLKLVLYLNTEKSIKTTFELPGRWVINDDTKLTVSNLSPADCSDVLFVDVVAFTKSNDNSYVSVENDVNGNPVRQFAYTVSGWKTIAPNNNHTPIIFSPCRVSFLPLMAASVRTLVVSWKDAADRKELVAREAFVIPSRMCSASAGLPPSATTASLASSISTLLY